MKLFILSTLLFAVAANAAHLHGKVACRIDDPGSLADLGGIQMNQLMELETFVDQDGVFSTNMLVEGEPMLESFPFPVIFVTNEAGETAFVLDGKVTNEAEQKSLEISISGALQGAGSGTINVVYQERNTGRFDGHATVKACTRVQ